MPLAGTLHGMQLDDNDIREFVELWELEFHEKLSPGEAQACASVLLELYFLLAKAPSDAGRTPPNNPFT